MSRYSPGVVENTERIARFVFSPMFFNAKTGKVKPNIFSHVFSAGCSIQRDSVAKDKELINLTNISLSRDSNSSWIGVLLAECHELRSIKIESSHNRTVCVYDTANKENPAHGEIGQTQHIVNPEDIVELREALFAAFNKGAMTPPSLYRNGTVWNNLTQPIQARR